MANEHRHRVSRVAVLDSAILAIAPILRLADAVIGVAVGVAAAWLGLRVTGQQAEASQ